MKAADFKKALGARKPVVGFQQFLPSTAVTEMAGLAGFDWVFLCTEHGSITIGTELENLIRTARGLGLTSIVRVTSGDYDLVLRCLELGADGVLAPRVRSRRDVEQVVEWAKYPPLGSRGMCGYTPVYGYGTRRSSPEQVNAETLVLILIEELAAFEELDDMLSVPGVDCAIFGEGDLSLQLGIRTAILDRDPDALKLMGEYRRRFTQACSRNGVAVGDIIRDSAKVPEMVAEGVTVFVSLPDTSLVQGALNELVQRTHGLLPP